MDEFVVPLGSVGSSPSLTTPVFDSVDVKTEGALLVLRVPVVD